MAEITDLETTNNGAVSMGVINTNFDNIDTDLTTINGDITTIEGDITTIEGSITTIEGDITDIEADITSLQGLVFNVKDYGALGDGSTDDSTAIQAALDACETAGGGTVTLPAGTYIIGATLTIPSGIVFTSTGTSGDSYHGTEEAGTVTIKAEENLNSSMLSVDDVSGTDFVGIRFDYDGTNQTTAARIIDGANYTGSGIWLNVNFRNCAFVNGKVGAYAVEFTSSRASDGLIAHIKFDDCSFGFNAGGAIKCTKVVWLQCYDCKVFENTNSNGVFFFTNSNCYISGCDMEGNTGTSIGLVGGAQVNNTAHIIDNDIELASGSNIAIGVSGYATKLNISNNQISAVGGTGISITGSSEFVIANNIMTQATSGQGNGIAVLQSSYRYVIIGNVIDSIFAASIDIHTGTHNYYIVTNNNTAGGVIADNGSGANKVVTNNL